MPQMFGKPSIRSKLSLGLAVPVAAVVLLGVAGAAGAGTGAVPPVGRGQGGT